MGLYLMKMQGFVYCNGLEKVKLFKLLCIILVSFDLHDRLTWPTQNLKVGQTDLFNLINA